MKTIIITLDVDARYKTRDEEQVKDTAGYFLDDIMDALQSIHGIVVKSVEVDTK
jgi:hypothetical protein